MIIKYEFVTGEVEKVEVPDEIGEFITASRREEEAAERRQRYYSVYSLDDDTLFEKKVIACERTPESDYILSEDNRRLYDALDTLTDVQRRRLEMLADGMSYREIASLENADHKAIQSSIEAVHKKLTNFF